MSTETRALPLAKKSTPVVHDGSISWRDLALVVMQLALVLLLFQRYQIENAGFLQVALVAFTGFLVHAILPLRHRLPFFAVLSVVATALLLGAANFAWMFAIGLLLIGICHAPVPFYLRAVLLGVVAVVLATQRAGVLAAPWSAAVWPILGSMFMFRIMIYFHELRHDKTAATPARTIAYFFMLPNACFPLFPVVDYKAFRRNYFDAQAYRIYQQGIDWMVRGVVHLLLYRLVYHHLTLAPAEVTSPELLMQFMVANFALYLKVSGLFHLIVGMLYLFGFRLPETHNRYFLASSFTDYYRRINIYWKDFMQKVFYYPTVFRLKKYGTSTAMVLATLWVFFLTWALHSYQWFWIRGTALFVPHDFIYWILLAVLVAGNTLYEVKYGRRRTLGTPKFSWRLVGTLTLKSFVTFWILCVLWSFWTTDSVEDWTSLWSALSGEYNLRTLLWPALTLVLIFIGNIPRTKADVEATSEASSRAWTRERAGTFALTLVLIGVSIEPVFSRFGTEVATVVHSTRHSGLSRLDAAKMERGYYEGLTEVNRFNSQLWETYSKRPVDWLDNQGAGLKRYVGGFAQTEMIPSFVYVTSYGAVTTNRFGLRDQEYAEQPAPDTFRAALLGSSSLMGWGVADDATFEALLEKRLNREFPGSPHARYELLNFGVQGYQPPQQLVNFERSLKLHPNAVMYVATGRELSRSVMYLAEVMHRGIAVPYAELSQLIQSAGVSKKMSQAEAQRRLMPYARDILTYVYGEIAAKAAAQGIQPIWVFLPQLSEGPWQEETEETVQIAERAGFIVVRLDGVFANHDIDKIRLAEWDEHPNAYGHQLIADELFQHLRNNRDRIFSTGGLATDGAAIAP